MDSDFTGFVLVGGKSSRMGADKFALEIDGETFLTRAAKVLEPVCETIKIILNQTQNIEIDFAIVRDFYSERGALGGIQAALKNCDTKFAVVLAVDLPFVSTEALENLQTIALASDKFPAVVPRQSDGRFQPLCAVYRVRDCLAPLEKLLDETVSASARDFLEIISPKYIEASRLSDDEQLFFNVNFPADYESLELRLEA